MICAAEKRTQNDDQAELLKVTVFEELSRLDLGKKYQMLVNLRQRAKKACCLKEFDMFWADYQKKVAVPILHLRVSAPYHASRAPYRYRYWN